MVGVLAGGAGGAGLGVGGWLAGSDCKGGLGLKLTF